MTEDINYKKLYEEAKEAEEEREKRLAWDEKCRKEVESDRKFGRWFTIAFFAYIIIGLKMCGPGDSGYGPGCYDADPTQYVDVYCE
jgi:hypothetical protein